jgi:hypothetical protein
VATGGKSANSGEEDDSDEDDREIEVRDRSELAEMDEST